MDERLLAALASYIDAHYEVERKTRHLRMDDLRTFAGPRASSIDLLGAINGLLKKMEDSFSEHLLYPHRAHMAKALRDLYEGGRDKGTFLQDSDGQELSSDEGDGTRLCACPASVTCGCAGSSAACGLYALTQQRERPYR